ncbi:hypothetical protein [Spirosoma aerophilum]
MKKLSYIASFLLLFLAAACTKDDIVSIRDAQATDNAITFTNFKYFERIPIGETSIAGGGNISITMTLPEASPRSFKEITQVGASTINASLNQNTFKTTANTLASKISVSGKTATFTTTIANYLAFRKLAAMPSTTTGGIVTFSDMQFFFLVTLDDNTTVVPMEYRVRVRA